GKSFSLASPSSLRLNLNQEFIKTANQLKVLEVRSQALTSGMQNVEQQINLMPVLARQYTDLNRQLNVATNSLDLVLKEKENLKLEAAKQALPWQMIAQPEITDQPVYPQPVKNLSLGLFGGLILGMGAALLAERLDPVYHSLSEIKEAISLPILGEIPLQKDLQPLSSQTPDAHAGDLFSNLKIGNTTLATSKQGEKTKNLQAATPFLEAFRSLNTNIRLLGSDNPINSLVISSSVPSEGKSTISSHLAQAAAAMGQRVLIIDADLRRPQVHHWLGKKNVKGLSNYLATGASLEEIIQPVDAWENLHMISAGEVPPDPTRLLASAKMQEFRNELKERNCYDLIIYDTPPVGGFADGRILANHTNGIILVLRVGKTDRSAIKQNIDTLKTANVPILGIIANGVSRGSHSSYYYERYYSRQS
ncbi:MAG: polysaccharide biosynthesis tyrosine autokinase, partial [Cyanobacteria bacterium J083]